MAIVIAIYGHYGLPCMAIIIAIIAIYGHYYCQYGHYHLPCVAIIIAIMAIRIAISIAIHGHS